MLVLVQNPVIFFRFLVFSLYELKYFNLLDLESEKANPKAVLRNQRLTKLSARNAHQLIIKVAATHLLAASYANG